MFVTVGNQEWWDQTPLPHTMIMFRGGTGGNFLAGCLYSHLYEHDEKIECTRDSIQNEYQYRTRGYGESSVERPDIDCTHLNLWFRSSPNSHYGSELYTKSRYDYCIDKYKSNNTKLILIQPGYHNLWYTEHLGMAKVIERSLFEKDVPGDHGHGVRESLVNKIPQYHRHYKFASWIARKRGVDVLDVDYSSLMQFDTKNQIKRICEFIGKPYHIDVVQDITQYHETNLQFMKKHNYPFVLTNESFYYTISK